MTSILSLTQVHGSFLISLPVKMNSNLTDLLYGKQECNKDIGNWWIGKIEQKKVISPVILRLVGARCQLTLEGY